MKRRGWTALVLIILLAAGCAAGLAGGTQKGCKHQWELIKTVQPTCTKEGREVYRCGKCGDEKTKTLPALGHEWGYCTVIRQATCTEDGLTRCFCNRDESHHKDQIISALGHDWGEWVTVKEAGLTYDGRKERACGRCGAKEEQAIPRQIQKKKYEIKVLAFPGETGRNGITAEQIAVAGAEGLTVAWICAVANTGEEGLWIRAGEEAQERIPLAAGEVTSFSLSTAVGETDLQAGAETVAAEITIYGETEDGTPVCETGATGWIRVTEAKEQETPDLTIRQELVPDDETEDGYRINGTIRCSVSVTNNGEDPFSQVEVQAFGEETIQTLENLMPGETRMLTLDYTVSRKDAITGYLCWAAAARGFRDGGKAAVSAQSDPLIVPVRVK